MADIAKQNVELGYYDESFFAVYSPEEIEKLNSYIKHQRDENISYVGMEQFRGKYLVQNRVTGAVYETTNCIHDDCSYIISRLSKETRLQWVKDFYDAISNFDISLPTPIMAGLRTSSAKPVAG